MRIEDTLRKYFAEQNDAQADIPGLGVFYLEKKSETNKVQILFKEETPSSQQFVSYLAFEEGCSEEEALGLLNQWVARISESLSKTHVAGVEDIGTFEVENGKVNFYPSVEQHLDLVTEGPVDSLKEEECPTAGKTSVSTASPVENVVEKPSSHQWYKQWWIYLVAAVVLFVAAVFAIPTTRNAILEKYQEMSALASLADATVVSDTWNDSEEDLKDELEAYFEDAESVVKDIFAEETKAIEREFLKGEAEKKKSVEPKKNVAPAKAPAKMKQETKNVASTSGKKVAAPVEKYQIEPNRFYLIVGSFAVLSNAEKVKANFTAPGYNTKILHNKDKNLYMVSIRDFDQRDAAIDYRFMMKEEKKIDCWIFSKK